MKNIIFALLMILSGTAAAAEAQQQDSPAQQMNGVGVAPKANPDELKHGKMYGTLSFTGVFAYQWTQNVPGTSRRLLAGWGATPELNLTKHLGFQGDFVSSYTDGVYPGISKFMIAAGPRYTMNPYWKGTPFFFGEAGETRTSYGKNVYGSHPGVDWNPTASAGIGFDMKLSPGFSIQVIPAEWTGERFDYNESWQNSGMARLGFVFNLR